MNYVSSGFFCCLCGKKGIPLPRKEFKQKPKGHLKNIYCIYCRKVTRHYEIKSEEDIKIFEQNFKNGYYSYEKDNVIPFNWYSKEIK